MKRSSLFVWRSVLGSVVFLASLGTAAEAGDEPSWHTPPRLRMVDGTVSLWRPSVGEWQDAPVNLPLAAGDVLATGRGSRAEVQWGVRSFLRIAASSELRLEDQDASSLRFRLEEGTVTIDIRDPRPPRRMEVSAGVTHAQIRQAGVYRFEVRAGGEVRVVTRRGGRMEISVAGRSRSLGPDSEFVAEPHGNVVFVGGAPPLDEWDRWNLKRSEQLLASAESPLRSDDVYGLDELSGYGEWRTVPTYGLVWIPRVPRSWVPYSTGRWVWDPFFGWTWVDWAPWGWAPFHYGRWVIVSSVWAWVPGPIVVRPVYAPALVVFFSGSGVRVGVGWGVPAVSWVPLGWGEPCYPWWGPVWFVGRPWWGGWHGARRDGPWLETGKRARDLALPPPDAFEHARNPRAVVAIARERFGSDPVHRARLEDVRLERPSAAAELPRRPFRASDWNPPARAASTGEDAIPGVRDVRAAEPPARGRHPGERRTRVGSAGPESRELQRNEGETRLPRRPAETERPAERRVAAPVEMSSEEQPKNPSTASPRSAAEESWGPFAPRFRSSRTVYRVSVPPRINEPGMEDSPRQGTPPPFDRGRGQLMRPPTRESATIGGDVLPGPPARPARRPGVSAPMAPLQGQAETPSPPGENFGSLRSAPDTTAPAAAWQTMPRPRAMPRPWVSGGGRFGESTAGNEGHNRRGNADVPRRPLHR